MRKDTSLPPFGTSPKDADVTDHLRQLCLFRRHVSLMIQAHKPRTPIWYSLCHVRDTLDRYQSIYTGDVAHYALAGDFADKVHRPAND